MTRENWNKKWGTEDIVYSPKKNPDLFINGELYVWSGNVWDKYGICLCEYRGWRNEGIVKKRKLGRFVYWRDRDLSNLKYIL